MTRPPLRSRAFVVLALVSLALGACASGGGPAATVGDVEITHEQLEADVATFRFVTGLSNAPCGTPADGESEQGACTRFTLSNVIQEELVKAYAAANDVAVDREAIASTIAQLEDGLGGPAELDTRLEAGGVTRAQLEDIARRLLLFSEVQAAVVADRVDEEALRDLYDQSAPQFTTVEVAHILLASRAEAEDVAELATAENFARLAQRRSTDPGSADAGGSLGAISEAQFRQQFDSTFVDAALSLEPGTISGVVETQFGFHVIELIRRDVAAFEDVREQLSAQQAPAVFQEWLQEQYESATIEVNPRYGRLDPSTGDVVVVRSTASGSSPAGPTAPAATGP